jgi:hypothetical protein
MDKVTSTLLAALKKALAEPGEQRLFRSGKLDGLFRSRGGAAAEAAARALRDGLLDVVRTEAKARVLIDWVRPTPKAVVFVHEQQAPTAALHELRDALQMTRMSLPVWVANLQQRLDELGGELEREMHAVSRRLDALCRRVEEAIERAEAARPRLDGEVARHIPWAGDALEHLDRRRDGGLETACPLSELFAAVRELHPALTVAEFHHGLRRLFDRGLVRLLPPEGPSAVAEPEYALLDGFATYYYAQRAGAA